MLEPEICSLLALIVGIYPTHRNSKELSKLLHFCELRCFFELILKDICCLMKKAFRNKRLPKSVKPKGFAFPVNSPCRYPVNLMHGLCDSITNALATHG